MPINRSEYKQKYSSNKNIQNKMNAVVPQTQGLPSSMVTNTEDDDFQEIQEASQQQIIQSAQQALADNEILDVEDIKVEGSEFIKPATDDEVRQVLSSVNLEGAKVLPKQAPQIVQQAEQQPQANVQQQPNLPSQMPQQSTTAQSMAQQVNQAPQPQMNAQQPMQQPNAQQSYAQQVNQSQFQPGYHPAGMMGGQQGNPQMYVGPPYNPYMGGNMQNPIGVQKEVASEVKTKALELVPGYEDPDEPMYVINMSDQAITFTKLYGNPKRDDNPEQFSPTLGTVDDRDPNGTVEPFLIIPAEKKEKAMSNYFFSKYLLEGVVKAVTEDEFRMFQNNYYTMMDQAMAQRNYMEAMAQNGMMEVGGMMSPQQQMMAQNYYAYQQQLAQNYGGFNGENVNIMSNIMNPNEFYQQQAIGEWFGANPEGSWGSLF